MSEKKPSTRTRRHVFILRLWQSSRESAEWIGEVQDVQTGEIIHIAEDAALMDWLKAKLKGKSTNQDEYAHDQQI